ncbi:transposase-like protein [Paraburkholderia tropica]|nr:transposase-like protein [Paraburkholderia tropica]
MTDTDFDFLPLRVTRTCADGKHRYDPEGKRKLIAACRRPGASLAGLALKAGVNANQLRKWVQLEERREVADVSHDAIASTVNLRAGRLDRRVTGIDSCGHSITSPAAVAATRSATSVAASCTTCALVGNTA